MDGRLEVVLIPVSDVDAAKAFYEGTLGFALDHDTRDGVPARLVQLTPRGSSCSIVISAGLSDAPAGSGTGLQLVVEDIVAAHEELAGRLVEVTPVQHLVRGEWRDGVGDPWSSFFFFNDPDGNPWIVQQGEIAPHPSSSEEISTP